MVITISHKSYFPMMCQVTIVIFPAHTLQEKSLTGNIFGFISVVEHWLSPFVLAAVSLGPPALQTPPLWLTGPLKACFWAKLWADFGFWGSPLYHVTDLLGEPYALTSKLQQFRSHEKFESQKCQPCGAKVQKICTETQSMFYCKLQSCLVLV